MDEETLSLASSIADSQHTIDLILSNQYDAAKQFIRPLYVNTSITLLLYFIYYCANFIYLTSNSSSINKFPVFYYYYFIVYVNRSERSMYHAHSYATIIFVEVVMGYDQVLFSNLFCLKVPL